LDRTATAQRSGFLFADNSGVDGPQSTAPFVFANQHKQAGTLLFSVVAVSV
jgi:hypothetical protein